MYCPRCAAKVKKDESLCHQCGLVFYQSEQPSAPQVQPEQEDSWLTVSPLKIALAAVGIVVVLVLAAVLIYSLTRPKSVYYIEPPGTKETQWAQGADLGDMETKDVVRYLRGVVKWYNRVDIDKAYIPSEFIPRELFQQGMELYEKGYVVEYTEASLAGQSLPGDLQDAYDRLLPANRILMQLSAIMITTDAQITITADNPLVIEVDEGDWMQLRECILDALEYYFE